MRELHKLKILADYSCIDPTNLNSFLQSIGSEFSIYTYSMLNAGIDCDSIRYFDIVIVLQIKAIFFFMCLFCNHIFMIDRNDFVYQFDLI